MKLSRLAARLSIRQVEGLYHADALADLVDQTMRRWWANLLRYMKANPQGQYFHAFFHQLPSILIKELTQGMARIALWGHKTAVEPLKEVLPKKWMQARFTEGLMEDIQPGLSVPGSDLPEPAAAMDKDEMWELLKKWLFPPPDHATLSDIIFRGSWAERIASITSLAKPQLLAQSLQTGYAAGENLQQLAKRLLPDLNGVRTSARRLARTEGMRIAHTVQERAWKQLGPLRVGYQVHATLDQHTRPWHAARSGTIYYDEPTGDQKGPEQCPHPPQEAADATERPVNTPHTAFNCRCYLTPVLRTKELTKEKQAVFTTAEDKLVPDPDVYSEWFDQAPVPLRMKAVGVKRYKEMEKLVGTPSWEHFIGENGDVLKLDQIKAETGQVRADRVGAVRALIQQRRRLTREVATFGFVRR